MQTNVPQFIDVEDKVIGPFTIKQAIYLFSTGGIIFLLYYFLDFAFLLIIAVPLIALAAALAFYKPEGRPFISFLKNFIGYSFAPKDYLWKRLPFVLTQKKKAKKKKETSQKTETSKESKIKNLKDLASLLDRGGRR